MVVVKAVMCGCKLFSAYVEVIAGSGIAYVNIAGICASLLRLLALAITPDLQLNVEDALKVRADYSACCHLTPELRTVLGDEEFCASLVAVQNKLWEPDQSICQVATEVLVARLREVATPLAEWLRNSGLVKCATSPGDCLYDSKGAQLL